MRKAHQNEVQREVNRFKQEFLRQFNSENREHLESLAAYKEEKELEEVRQEILSLSEKYSQKCVEAISLEEKLRNSQQKLRHAQQVIHNYEMKSKNLRLSHDEMESDADLNSVSFAIFLLLIILKLNYWKRGNNVRYSIIATIF